MQFRIGQGVDIHAFQEGRKLILGGVEIPHSKGLLGHSDADVLTHAVMDALLGAIGLEDIGCLFPDTDPSYKDANSILLLKTVMCSVLDRGWEVVNADISLLIEAPRIAPYRAQMRATIAATLGVAVDQCTIKATTMEKLGCIGREEGVFASCAVLIQKK